MIRIMDIDGAAVTEVEMRETFRVALVNAGCLNAQASELADVIVNTAFHAWGAEEFDNESL